MILTFIDYAVTSAAIWILIFLFHELMHIKSQGIRMTGKILINYPHGMMAIPKKIKEEKLFYMSGGILSSLACFILFFMSQDIQFQYAFFVMGWIQLLYGICEGWFVVKFRYILYLIVGILASIYWFMFGG